MLLLALSAYKRLVARVNEPYGSCGSCQSVERMLESNGINHRRGGVANLVSIIINLMPPILAIFNLHVNLSTAGFFLVEYVDFGHTEKPWAYSSVGYCTGSPQRLISAPTP